MAQGTLATRIAAIIERVQRFKPVRVWLDFTESRGLLLAAGLSYQAIFALFAALWVGFATGGLFLQANPAIADALFTLLSVSVPGLISWGDSSGLIDPQVLFEAQVLGITGIIAAAVLAFTAVGWLSSARDAVRALFHLPGQRRNFFLLKLKDVGLALAFGVTLLISAALSVASTEALGFVLDWLGLNSDSLVAVTLGRVTGLVLMLALDTAVLMALYRVLSGLVIAWRRLLFGSLIGAVGLGVLKILGTSLLTGAGRNPLLASFAVLLGLFIWFNLICTVMLVAATWIAVGMADAGRIADPVIAKERAREEAELRARIADELERERAAEREAEEAAARSRRGGWLGRLFGRRRGR